MAPTHAEGVLHNTKSAPGTSVKNDLLDNALHPSLLRQDVSPLSGPDRRLLSPNSTHHPRHPVTMQARVRALLRRLAPARALRLLIHHLIDPSHCVCLCSITPSQLHP